MNFGRFDGVWIDKSPDGADFAGGVVRYWLLLIVLTAACAAPPAPEPSPLPTREAVQAAAPEYLAWLPVVAAPEPTRGWAKAYGNLSDAELARLGIEWYYDYGLRYPLPHRAGIEYVPFLWCDIYPAMRYDAPSVYYFDALAKLPEDYSRYLLFLNEPDLRGGRNVGSQCERTPRQAAYMLLAARELCTKCIMVGPAVSHEDYRAGWPWLRAFYAEVQRLGIAPPEVAAIHTYLDEPPHLIINSLFEMLAEFPGAPRTAWVTEFGTCNPSQAARMLAYYERSNRVERWAWFTARGWPAECMNLLDADGRLTPVGNVFGGRGDAASAYP